MNVHDRRIADRDALLTQTLGSDRYAVAALERGDDLALLRRIAKAGLTEALPLAIERALMRGHGDVPVRRAAGLSGEQLREHYRAIYAPTR